MEDQDQRRLAVERRFVSGSDDDESALNDTDPMLSTNDELSPRHEADAVTMPENNVSLYASAVQSPIVTEQRISFTNSYSDTNASNVREKQNQSLSKTLVRWLRTCPLTCTLFCISFAWNIFSLFSISHHHESWRSDIYGSSHLVQLREDGTSVHCFSPWHLLSGRDTLFSAPIRVILSALSWHASSLFWWFDVLAWLSLALIEHTLFIHSRLLSRQERLASHIALPSISEHEQISGHLHRIASTARRRFGAASGAPLGTRSASQVWHQRKFHHLQQHISNRNWLLQCLVAIIFIVTGIRLLLGFIFGRGTGFALPALFFHDAVYESFCGIQAYLPPLWMLVVVHGFAAQNLLGSALFHFQFRGRSYKVRTGWIIGALCAPSVFAFHFRWSMWSSLILTVIYAVVALLVRHFKRLQGIPTSKNRFMKPVMRSVGIILVSLIINEITKGYFSPRLEIHTFETPMTLLFLTAPRRAGARAPLIDTLISYNNSLSLTKNNVQLRIFTHFTVHAPFDEARNKFGSLPLFSFVRFNGTERNLRKHLTAALEETWRSSTARKPLVTLLEDDFPPCDEMTEWWPILNLYLKSEPNILDPHLPITNSELLDPSCSALFLGTGGSGLVMPHHILPRLVALLQDPDYEKTPTDVLMQDCLRGAIPSCIGCRLYISPRLLMHHTGFDISTSGRLYGADEFQCGWRHPFHGADDVIVLSP